MVERALLCVACLISVTAEASRPHGTIADKLTAMPAANVAKPLRTETPLVALATPPIAFMSLGGTWQATWDPATGVPRQLWGSSPVPGSSKNASIAEAAARAMLSTHLDLFAPGSVPGDFQLVGNHDDGAIRTVAFAQYANGHRIVGGQISFWFKNDRLFIVSSQALPHVTFDVATTRMALAPAISSIREAVALPNAPVVANGDDVILPLVGDSAILGYRLVSQYMIDGGADGRYQAYVGPAGVVAVHQLNDYTTGTVDYNGVIRYPARGRMDYAAARAHENVSSVVTTTAQDGTLTWPDAGTVPIVTTTDGDLVTVVDKINATAIGSFTIDPGQTLSWDASAIVEADAQVSAFINANLAKAYVRANVDSAMMTLDDTITVNVNLAQDCNAFFDGSALNFFHRTTMCENTALIQDVVFHEYGHRVHTAEIIDGVGSFDSAMSEGVADFLSVSINNDSGMGRGFFFTDVPLRELDPPDSEWRWPIDIGEIHHTGMIIGGALWDLRKEMILEFGMDQGVVLANSFYVGALRRSVDIPSSLLAILAADDDDGDLTNGTPHECAIRNAYGRHGLRTVTGAVEAPGYLDEDALSVGIVVDVSGLSPRCSGDALGTTTVTYSEIANGDVKGGTLATTTSGDDRFFATLPLAPYTTITFQAQVGFTDGSKFILPDNLADPYYQAYVGHVVQLYCTDFESEDPFANGWVGGSTGSDGSPVDSPWVWGTPTAGTTDPHAAYSGSKIIAQVLDGDYLPSTHSYLNLPPIDVGEYTDVRLQYRRWLGVEDSHYDQAKINANGAQVWENSTQNMGDSSSQHHIDKEWRFQDVSLTPFFYGHNLNVSFTLDSDTGLELGGWQIDDVCVVANPTSVCGDGIKTVTESCDDGSANADLPDKCRTWCKAPACGDGIVDTGEECDEGSATATCSVKCKNIATAGGGCCSASGGTGSIALGMFVLALLRRRKPRARL